ncbi:MAG: death on curing protein [Anaerocolumna sp.]|jgi:death-on-curing protein|nr:death on curing protein [Anaerocolumna sp.]
MKKISREQVLMLHSMVIKQSGGIDGIRDCGLLDSALHVPFQSFDKEELYPSIPGKVARLCYSTINNHPFIDENKRIGVLIMLVFLKINNVTMQCQDKDIIDLGLGVASGKYDTNYIMEWIILHTNS